MKAVIWTDVIQTVLMFSGVVLSIIFGRRCHFRSITAMMCVGLAQDFVMPVVGTMSLNGRGKGVEFNGQRK
jgi:Na+/proline symporter